MAQWIRHLTTNQGIPGSSPGRVAQLFLFFESTVQFPFSPFENILCKTKLRQINYRKRTFVIIVVTSARVGLIDGRWAIGAKCLLSSRIDPTFNFNNFIQTGTEVTQFYNSNFIMSSSKGKIFFIIFGIRWKIWLNEWSKKHYPFLNIFGFQLYPSAEIHADRTLNVKRGKERSPTKEALNY